MKLTKKFGEDSKVSLRNLRRDMIQEIEKLEKSRVISEDDKNKGKKDAEEMLHKFEKQLTDLITHITGSWPWPGKSFWRANALLKSSPFSTWRTGCIRIYRRPMIFLKMNK